jgi:hypothetical protein
MAEIKDKVITMESLKTVHDYNKNTFETKENVGNLLNKKFDKPENDIIPIENGGTGNNSGYIRAGAEEGSTIGALATAEGRMTTASGHYSHAEGNYAKAIGESSHAEGQSTESVGVASHSEGDNTNANGNFSHAEGQGTIAGSGYQHVQGKYNIEDKAETYAHIVGNGEGVNSRSNAHTVDWDGNGWFAGDVYVGGAQQNEGEKLVKINDIYPVGSVYTTATSTNPSSYLGGTWECFNKQLAYKLFDYNVDGSFFTPSENTADWAGYVTIEGHTAIFRIEILTTIEIGESSYEWGTFDFQKMGFSRLSYNGKYLLGAGDDANAIVECTLDYSTGKFSSHDVIPKSDNGLLPANSWFITQFTMPISSAYMYEDNCDRFYWKRTA